MTIVIGRACHADVLARAAASPDREICGLLFGTLSGGAGCIDDAVPARNVADQPARRFEIDPGALIAAHRIERAGGPRLIGCYHSHPHGPATPSAADVAAAEPGRVWLIVGGGGMRAWLFRLGAYEEVSLAIR